MKSKYTFLWNDYQPNRTIEWNLKPMQNLRSYEWNKTNNIIQVARDNMIHCYHSTKDLNKDVQRGKLFFNQIFVKQYFKEIEENYQKQMKIFKFLEETNFKKFSDKELLNTYIKAGHHWGVMISFFRTTQEEGTRYLIKELKTRFTDKEASLLMSSIELDLANKEFMDWTKLIKKPFSRKLLINHVRKYSWTVISHFTLKDVIETLTQRYNYDKKHLQEFDFVNEKKKLKIKQAKILKKYPEMKGIVELLQKLALNRMKVKSCWAGIEYYLLPLIEEISRRTKEKSIDVHKYYLEKEVKKLVLKKKKLSEEEKQRRELCFVGLWKNKKIRFFSGEKAEKIAKRELKELYTVKDKQELKGMTANPGNCKGIVRILPTNNIEKTRYLRQNFKQGEILITGMTQPNIMDIASKAGAIVTDEGGMLSHAAIISREFKVPCIVGTHFATQVFKDGEYVEVDADKGIVSKVDQSKIIPNHKDYKKFFTAECEITCLHSEFLMKGSLGKADLFLTSKDNLYNIYLNKDKEKLCLEEGLKIFRDSKKYKKHLKEFKDYVKLANNHLIPKYSKIPVKLTKEEFKKDLELISKFWYYYGTTEFPYTDMAYNHMQKTKNKEMERNLNEWSKFKFKGREVLNAYFFKNGVLDNILGYVSKKFLKTNDARYMYSEELLAAFDRKKPNKTEVNNRKKCYTATIIDGNIITFPYKQALELNKEFTYVKKKDEIHGITVNPGIARGRVVISPMLNDHKEILKIDKLMKEGDILVAETTSPDVFMLCKKASAIVADQGGMLSHAAIVSREMGIPCIIQTEVATKILKNGDYVEVDADKGIIRKIKKEQVKQAIKKKTTVKTMAQKTNFNYRPEDILWFKDVNKSDIPTVGGKGANLGEMFSHFNIPNGFCVTVVAYKKFMDETGIGAHIHGLLDKLDVEGIEELDKTSKEIRDLILKQKFPDYIKKKILSNYKKLKHKIVAIRSSATAEDLPTASFAGQQDTYLNVEGEANVIRDVQKCWASLFTSRAIYYREKNNFHHRDVLISVVIQEMIDAEYAGVIFTVDPVNKKFILIEFVEGLGEALVSGMVTPNSYFLNKKTHKVDQAHENFIMDHDIVEHVSKMGEKIEKHYGKPQDIEFALDKKGELFILQSRPITTL